MSTQAFELEPIDRYRAPLAASVSTARPRVVAPAPAAVPRPAPRPAFGRTRRALQHGIFPLGVLAAWWVASAWSFLPANILPSPAAVAQTFWELAASGELLGHTAISLRRVAEGAAIGLTLGLALGVGMGFSASFESWIGPFFRAIAQVPSIVLIPLFMMLLGIDDKLKLFVMAKACVIPLALVTSEGIRTIPRSLLEVGAVFRLRRATLIRRVILPGALPSIFTGIRQGLAHVWVALVAVEVMASAEGIGYLMTWGRLIFQLDVVLVCVAVIGAIGFLLDFSLRRAEAHLLKWKGSDR